MTKLEKIAQQALREKVAILESIPVSRVQKVVEDSKGAIVWYRSGPVLHRRIPLEYWIGEKIDD